MGKTRYNYRSHTDRILPGLDEVRDQRVVNPEGVFHFEVVVLWVVHALLSVGVAEQDVVQPLDGHGGNFPVVGLVVLLAGGARQRKGKEKK